MNDILVIGAGLAGLACTQKLIEKNAHVRLIEASHIFGGRVQPLNFQQCKLEAGGQTLHHKDNVYYNYCVQNGAQMINDIDDLKSIYDPIQQKPLTKEEFEEQYPQIDGMFEEFMEYRNNQVDQNVLTWLSERNYDMRFMHLYRAVLGAEFGGDIKNVSSRGVGQYKFDMPQQEGDYGFTNIYHTDIISKIFKDAIKICEYNKPVLAIDYSDDGVKVTYKNGQENQTEIFNRIVCCFPITQYNKIQWTPKFSPQRQEIIEKTGMEKGSKMFIIVDKPFLFDKPTLFAPLVDHTGLWSELSQNGVYVLMGIITADANDQLIQLGQDVFAQRVVDAINEQYKKDLKILKVINVDWGNTPYIEGLYSYPKTGQLVNYRDIMREPIDNKIYFAGEAFHSIYYQTLHGAVESGEDVAKLL